MTLAGEPGAGWPGLGWGEGPEATPGPPASFIRPLLCRSTAPAPGGTRDGSGDSTPGTAQRPRPATCSLSLTSQHFFLFSPTPPFYSLFSPSFSFSPFSLIFPVPVLFLSPALNNAERKRGQAWLKSSLIITGPPRDLGSGSPPQHPERRMRSPAPLPSRGQRLGTSRSRLRAGGRGIPQIRVVLAVKIQLLCVTQTAPKWDGVVVLPS